MSAVSRKLIPASSAASTTDAVAAASSRPPKLLQPSPTTDTSSDPILRVSIANPSPGKELIHAEPQRTQRRSHGGTLRLFVRLPFPSPQLVEPAQCGRLPGGDADHAERREPAEEHRVHRPQQP